MKSVKPQCIVGSDAMLFTVAMALVALILGLQFVTSFWFLTVSLALCAVATTLPGFRREKLSSSQATALMLASGIGIQAVFLLLLPHGNLKPLGVTGVGVMSTLGILQVFDLRRTRLPFTLALAVIFLCASGVTVKSGHPLNDTYDLLQDSSSALLHGSNPYEIRIRNIYGDYFGLGGVDKGGYLTYGFPYPPLNVLMALPAFVVLGDVRYALAVAMAASAVLMAMAHTGPAGRVGALAGALFLTTPFTSYILRQGWTEPLLVLNFSLAMFCACRWRKGLPWALGLFFATKQYTVLALPLLPLLVDGPDRWKELWGMAVKAGVVVAAINLPFFLWNAREFMRALVTYQVVLPFRTDSLSYVAWAHNKIGISLPPWLGFVVVVPAIALALRYGRRSPAGFAGAVTMAHLFLFAFSKRAFMNYYYFVIAAACWAVAVATLPKNASTE